MAVHSCKISHNLHECSTCNIYHNYMSKQLIMARTQCSHTDKSIVRPFEILSFFYFKTMAVMKIELVRREVQKMIRVKIQTLY